METTKTVHPFEQSGCGRAPFRLEAVYEDRGPKQMPDGSTVGSAGQPMGTCAHCGAGIAVVCVISDADGKSFTVGSTCVYKTNDAGLSSSTRIVIRNMKGVAKRDAQQAKRMQNVAKYPEWTTEEKEHAEDAVAEIAQLGSIDKFGPEDVERYADFLGDFVSLDFIANSYARNYTGDFSYMVDMHNALHRWGDLSAAQSKGVLNCMLAQVRFRNRKQERQQQLAQQTPRGELEDGMYLRDGIIYKVQHAVHGSGKQYAKQLVRDEDDATDWHFEYAVGMVYKLGPSMKMSLEQAKEFGALYGTCCVCGRTLTDENSIEAGIGPICASRF